MSSKKAAMEGFKYSSYQLMIWALIRMILKRNRIGVSLFDYTNCVKQGIERLIKIADFLYN